jgi:cytochrome P450
MSDLTVTAAAETEPVLFNPFEPGFFDRPYDQYARVRAADPVHLSAIDSWMLFAYDDCFALLRDPHLSVEDSKAQAINPDVGNDRFAELREAFPDIDPGPPSRGILSIDPPDHTRIRKLMSKVFTPKRVNELRPKIQHLVDGALDDVAASGEMDVISDLAFPLPFTVISEMLGMPDSDRDQLRDWSHTVVKTLDPIITVEEGRDAIEASRHLADHLAAVIEWKRANPGDDLLTELIHAEEDGESLTAEELQDQVALLFVAGHETTVNLIGNGTLALLRNRAQLELLRDDPSLDVNAVDELLRYDSPVQFSRRIVLEDHRIGDVVIEAGRFVLTCLGSANHDPGTFGPDADELDLRRPNAPRHLSFGSGVHHCLGASLARLEAQVALGTLVRRFGDLELATETPAWNNRVVLRGLDDLPVAF